MESYSVVCSEETICGRANDDDDDEEQDDDESNAFIRG